MATLDQVYQYIKSTPFETRKQQYESFGLGGAFGDFRGTTEQNTALFNKGQTPTAESTKKLLEQGNVLGQQASLTTGKTFEPAIFGVQPPPPPPTAQDVISETTPTTTQNIYDLLFEQAKKGTEGETKEATFDLAAATTRGTETIGRDVATLQRTAQEGISELGLAGEKKQAQIGEKAAGFGGAFSGITKKSQAEIAQEVATKQTSLKAKLGDFLYNTFSDFEKNFGTKFLESLSIPEAQQFTKLPAPVRGAVMVQYQEAIQKAEEKAQKGVVDALDKLGFVVIGGQIVQKPSEARAEAGALRAETSSDIAQRRLELAEEAAARAERKAGEEPKGTQTEREREETGGFTIDQMNKGISVAGVSKDQFSKWDFETKNYFINNNDVIKSVKEDIDDMEKANELASQYKTLNQRQDLPPEVRQNFKVYIENQVNTLGIREKFNKELSK